MKAVKNADLGQNMIKIPDPCWAVFGNGISAGVRAGSPISSLYRLRKKKK
jgi:hypothetical protein